jgi:hypothetical protein
MLLIPNTWATDSTNTSLHSMLMVVVVLSSGGSRSCSVALVLYHAFHAGNTTKVMLLDVFVNINIWENLVTAS